MITKNVNEQILVALLKEFGIRKIVVSAGMQNFGIASTVQEDDWFEAYSVVDERSAAYFATGLAFESGEPVVLSCTGATASRNYLSGLTEAFYRKLPIIAVTSTHFHPDAKDLSPQSIDRSISQNDVKLFSTELPPAYNEVDFKIVEKRVNEALVIATEQKLGPVHINSITTEAEMVDHPLPKVSKVAYYNYATLQKIDAEVLANRKIGVFIGSHKPFETESEEALSDFTEKYGAVVFCDHTTNYFGKNKVLISKAFGVDEKLDVPDLLIDLGGVSGDYNSGVLRDVSEVWRISEDGVMHDRFNKLTRLFECKEVDFFHQLNAQAPSGVDFEYQRLALAKMAEYSGGELPLSNTLVAKTLSELLPSGSYLHLGILNSLRNMDFFELKNNIITSSNVGGFGIDGPLSTIIGQAMVNRDKLHFCVLGDLAFFYDMNALGIRHIGNNLRILVVNNGRGAEFRLNRLIEEPRGAKLDEFTAGAGHFGNAKAWAEAMGCKYMAAKTKRDFSRKARDFVQAKVSNKPVVFEVFTEIDDEKRGLDLIKKG